MKIEEYLNRLENKELIYIFLSIPIIVFIVYYNFVYPDLTKKYNKLIKIEKKKNKELVKVSKEIRKVKISKKILVPTRKKLESLKEDFKYISYTFTTLELLKLNKTKIYSIFTQLLNKSSQLNLNTSFDIKWNQNIVPPFNESVDIVIKGKGSFISVVRYLRFMEHLKALVYIKDFKMAVKLTFNKVQNPKEKKKKQIEFGFLDLTDTINAIKNDTISAAQEFIITLQIVGIKK